VQCAIVGDVVVRKSPVVVQLPARKDQPLRAKEDQSVLTSHSHDHPAAAAAAATTTVQG
jgi:hypothetical protein